jgi:hypothetical protein
MLRSSKLFAIKINFLIRQWQLIFIHFEFFSILLLCEWPHIVGIFRFAAIGAFFFPRTGKLEL